MPNTPGGNRILETRIPSGSEASNCVPSLLERLCEGKQRLVLEEMASGFAHEVNQPIAAIATFAQAAQRMLMRPEPALLEAAEALRQISEQALSAGEEIRRIRCLYRANEESREVCQMGDVVTELIPTFHALAPSRDVRLECSVREGLPSVCIARLRIQQVLLALVRNAIDASRQASLASVHIDVSGDRYSVLTAVEDSGTGVTEAARSQLFSPFFTTKIGGTGLDLACSRATIEAHDGRIGFDEAITEGAKFWFSLPAVNEAS